ncbi:MAG: DUF2267 domain-containing protein [Hyphomonas sp.]
MSNTGLRQFDETLHLTNTWLKEIMAEMEWEDRQRAYRALRSTLHALRDRITVTEGAHLAAQLPLMVKGIFYDGWSPSRCGGGDRSLAAFLTPIVDSFDKDPRLNAADVARAVIRILHRHVSEGEMQDVIQGLPEPIRRAVSDS